MLKIASSQRKLLAKLTDASGVSGDEGAVREIVLKEIRPYADEITVDALGSVLAVRRGSGKKRLRVMVAAHMDEVGFMLTYDDGKGIFRFGVVGGVDPRQLVGKPVWVGEEKIPGVIGSNPIHLTTAAERKRSISLDALRIDVGPKNAARVKVGDRAVFATEYRRIGPSVRAKALDDRVGVCSLIELLKNTPPNIDLLAAFTVQEENGLRGARVAAFSFDPDLALVLDCTPAKDFPAPEGEENTRYNVRLDHGPAIYTADRATLSDPRLIRHFVATAEAENIPYQMRQPGGGGTDAGAIHKQRAGIPSLSISVPARYLHTAASIMRVADWQNTLNLAHAGLSALPADILKQERAH